MTKNAERREKYRRLGAAISVASLNEMAWHDHTGDHQFEPVVRAANDKHLSSRMFGPQFKTLQFERTARR